MFVLDPNGEIPLYEQLYHRIRESILAGKLAADAKLPSVRVLATELSISRNTVESSFQELYSEGYIYSKPRSGYYVSPLDRDAVPSPPPRRHQVLKTVRADVPECEFDFHPARLDPCAFPTALWRKCVQEILRRGLLGLSQYTNPQGEPDLRHCIRSYLERSRGVLCDPEQIVVCSGLQQSLDIVAHLRRDEHPLVAIEEPGFHLPRSVFRNHGLEVSPIPVAATGMDLELLAGSGSTIAYVTPSHQFPMGHVMPVAQRLKLIEWAQSSGRLIIEDDYDSELRYHGKPIPSLQGLNPDANVAYLGTFSKVLSPALRMSYLILPHSLLAIYQRLFRDYCCSVPLLEQLALAEFMKQGHWDRHLRRMRALYRKKHDALLQAVERHFAANAVVIGQGAGLHVVLQLVDPPATEELLIEKAGRNGIVLFPFSETQAQPEPGTREFLIGFGGLTVPEIDRGIERLAKAWYG